MDNYQKSYFLKRIDQTTELLCDGAISSYPIEPTELGHYAWDEGVYAKVGREVTKRNRKLYYPWRSDMLSEALSMKDYIVAGLKTPGEALEFLEALESSPFKGELP